MDRLDTPVAASLAARLISFTPSFSRRRKKESQLSAVPESQRLQERPNRGSHYMVFERADVAEFTVFVS